MIKKKLIVGICLVSTGFLVAADKKKLTFHAKIEISDPLGQVLGMMQERFAAMDSSLNRIDSKVAQLAERVDGLDSKLQFYSELQTASYFEPMGNLKRIQDKFNSCQRETYRLLLPTTQVAIDIVNDIADLMELFKKCDDVPLFDSVHAKTFLISCLLETQRMIKSRRARADELAIDPRDKEWTNCSLERGLKDIDTMLSRFQKS